MSRLARQPPPCWLGLESVKRDDIIGYQRDARAPLKVPRALSCVHE
jgi:hypothetical protein